jgi:hypothetical protein
LNNKSDMLNIGLCFRCNAYFGKPEPHCNSLSIHCPISSKVQKEMMEGQYEKTVRVSKKFPRKKSVKGIFVRSSFNQKEDGRNSVQGSVVLLTGMKNIQDQINLVRLSDIILSFSRLSLTPDSVTVLPTK